MTDDSDQSNKHSLKIFPIDSRPYDMTYGEWTSKWWQWVMSIPRDKNPLLDTTGEYCCQGQNGPVWFLAGTADIIQIPYIKTDEELIAHTAKDIDRWILLNATVDGFKLNDLDKYRVSVGPFDLAVSENNIWNMQAGTTKAVSDGFWLFLEPLDEGIHNIFFHGIEPHFETQVIYHVTIMAF